MSGDDNNIKKKKLRRPKGGRPGCPLSRRVLRCLFFYLCTVPVPKKKTGFENCGLPGVKGKQCHVLSKRSFFKVFGWPLFMIYQKYLLKHIAVYYHCSVG